MKEGFTDFFFFFCNLGLPRDRDVSNGEKLQCDSSPLVALWRLFLLLIQRGRAERASVTDADVSHAMNNEGRRGRTAPA